MAAILNFMLQRRYTTDFAKSPPEILMSSVSVSQIKRETLYTPTILQACRADPGLSVLTGYYGVYQSILGPTAGHILFIFY